MLADEFWEGCSRWKEEQNKKTVDSLWGGGGRYANKLFMKDAHFKKKPLVIKKPLNHQNV